MIHVLYADTSVPLHPKSFHDRLGLLPVFLREKNQKYHKLQDRMNHLSGQILLIEAIRRYGYNHTLLEDLQYDSYGKPHFPNEIEFNISHSGRYVICAITRAHRVGVDIEEIRLLDFTEVYDTMNDAQWDVIKSSNDPFRLFFQFWTIKESVIKADSRGLSLPLIDINITDNCASIEHDHWHLHSLNIHRDYCAVLACNNDCHDLIQMCEIKL